jgi:adenylylsulfate kinase
MGGVTATATVYWVTGLPGSGKTVIGAAVQELLHEQGRTAVLLDGDALRTALGDVHGHTPDERRYLAGTYARLCGLLAGQGVDVVCATVSMFAAVRDWNRANLPGYREIYVTAPQDQRHARRALYTEAPAAEVPGSSPAYELPETPDLVVANDGTETPREIAGRIVSGVLAPLGR